MSDKDCTEPTRIKVIEDLMNQNLSQAEVGRRLGLSRARIGQIARAHGLTRWAKGPSSLLTERQSSILAFIRDFEENFPYPPTVREVMEGCGLSSTAVVSYNLAQLADRGYIRRVPWIARGLLLTDRGRSRTLDSSR